MSSEKEVRRTCIAAAANLAGSAEELLLLALSFEAYAHYGYRTGIDVLKGGPDVVFGPKSAAPEPAASAASPDDISDLVAPGPEAEGSDDEALTGAEPSPLVVHH